MKKQERNILVRIDTDLFAKFNDALQVYNANEDIRLDKSKVLKKAIADFIKKINKKY